MAKITEIKEGTILGFTGDWNSGLGYLVIQTDEGQECIPCENGVTVRALDSCFGGVIGKGHTCLNNAIRGQNQVYS